MSKILTVCSQGLMRSVALADVLKLHFEPVDVIPIGSAKNANSAETLQMLCDWADHIVLMEPHYQQRLEQRMEVANLQDEYRIHVCNVGPDTYGGQHNRRRALIDLVWNWTRQNQEALGITEHNKRL